MGKTPPIQYSGPVIDHDVPWSIARHLQIIYGKLGNHTQAFSLQQAAINNIKPGGGTTIVEQGGGGGGGPTPGSGNGIPVNDRSGVTSYATTSGDNGALIVLADASPIAVSLIPQTPPWGCFIANQGALGAGTATLTPASGTISYAGNPGASSMPLLPTYCAMVAFDGTNWFAWTEPIAPATFGAVTHEFLTAYNAATGAFTAAQPAYSDLTGTPQLPNTIAPTTGEYLTGYDATTGNFSASTPAGLSVTIVTAQLTPTGAQGSITFTGGILTAQTPAT